MRDYDDLAQALLEAGWEEETSETGRGTFRLDAACGECRAEISADRDGVRLDMIRADPIGEGAGSEGLASLVRAALEVNVPLLLDVRPQPDCPMGEEELAGWYERHGAGDDPGAGHFGMSFRREGLLLEAC